MGSIRRPAVGFNPEEDARRSPFQGCRLPYRCLSYGPPQMALARIDHMIVRLRRKLTTTG